MSEEEVKEYKDFLARAEKGDMESQYLVGVCFSSGQGVQKDEAQSIAWYTKSAAQGFKEAQYAIWPNTGSGRSRLGSVT